MRLPRELRAGLIGLGVALGSIVLAAAGSITLSALGLFHVPNTAMLRLVPTTGFSEIWRDGVTTPGDTEPLPYFPSGAACSLDAGVGDGVLQIASSDGKCWIPKHRTRLAVSEAFGDGVGAADQSVKVQALLSDIASLGLKMQVDWDGSWTAAFVVPQGVTLTAPNSQMSGATAAAGAAYVQCPASWTGMNTGTPCVTQLGSGLQGGHVHDIEIRGVAIGGTMYANAGVIGFSITNGESQAAENIDVDGFPICWQLRGNGGEGNHAEIHGMYASRCSTEYVDVDGWRETNVYGGRLGGNGASNNLNASYFINFENNNAGTGPDTFSEWGLQMNEDSSHTVNCAVMFGNINSGAVGLGEFGFHSHIEAIFVNAASSGFFCTDSTVKTLGPLWLSGASFNNDGSNQVPLFVPDPHTSIAHVYITENEMLGCTTSQESLNTARFQRVTDVHIANNEWCGTINYQTNYGRYPASFALVNGVEVMTVSGAATTGIGPIMFSTISGTTIGQVTILADSTTPNACGGSNCTGTATAAGGAGGSTGTYLVSGTAGTVVSQTVTQDSLNYLVSTGNTFLAALSLGGYWDGLSPAQARALLVSDTYGMPVIDLASGFVAAAPAPQADPANSYILASCAATGCGVSATQNAGPVNVAQTSTSSHWRDLTGGMHISATITIPAGTLLPSGNYELEGAPLTCLSNTTGGGQVTAFSGFSGLSFPMFPLPKADGTIPLYTQTSGATVKVTQANFSTAGGSITVNANCPAAK